MNRLIKPLIVLLTFLATFSTKNGSSSHIVAAEVTYQHVSNNDYNVRILLYRNCAGFEAPADATLDVSSSCGGGSYVLPPVDSAEITMSCYTINSSCNGGTWEGRKVYVYESVVTLNPCSDWVLSWSDCCRSIPNAQNVNTTSGMGTTVFAELNNLNGPNSSPTFMKWANPFICNAAGFCVNNTSYDFDGDSLVYSLVTPLDDAGAPVTYQSGYSAQAPFGFGIGFSPFTGNICLPSGQTLGGYLYAVRIDEYRNGNWIGSMVRDAQASLVSCSAPGAMTLQGTITDSSGIAASGAKIYLYDYALNAGNLQIIDSTTTNATGDYSITTSIFGQYMIKAIPDTIANPGTLPSYYLGSYYWNAGTTIYTICDSLVTANVTLAHQGNPVGSGVVSGYLYGNGLLRGGVQPESGYYVYAIDRSNGEQVAHAVSDQSGYYEIGQLEPGDYELLVDIPGLIHLSTHFFTISSSENYNNYNFIADSDGIRATGSSLSINDVRQQQESKIYPNPANNLIRIDGIQPYAQIEIYSLVGTLVYSGNLNNNELRIHSLSAGTYVVNVDGCLPAKLVVSR